MTTTDAAHLEARLGSRYRIVRPLGAGGMVAASCTVTSNLKT